MNFLTLEDLKETSICIDSTIDVFSPQAGIVITFTPSFEENDKEYYSNNNICVFVESMKMYVIPCFVSVKEILISEGFKEASMYVPFSNWDYPVAEKEKWENLLKAFRKTL